MTQNGTLAHEDNALKAAGARLAHPDGTWVQTNGTNGTLRAILPSFDLGPHEGDLIALTEHEHARLVRITRIERPSFEGLTIPIYHFDETGAPTRRPTPSRTGMTRTPAPQGTRERIATHKTSTGGQP